MTVASSKPMTQGALYASLSRSLSLSASELCHHHKPSQSAGGQGTDVGKRWFPANQLTAHCSHGRAQLSSVMPNLGQQNCLADPQTCGQKSMSITVRHCNGQLLCSITVAINNGHRQGSQNYTSLRKPIQQGKSFLQTQIAFCSQDASSFLSVTWEPKLLQVGKDSTGCLVQLSLFISRHLPTFTAILCFRKQQVWLSLLLSFSN